jgi:hypothetical protein
MKGNHSLRCETDSFEDLPDDSAEHGQEAVYDVSGGMNAPDGTDSVVSSHSSRQKSLFNGEEEEEGCTIGGSSRSDSSSSTHSLSQAHQLSASLNANASSRTHDEHLLVQTLRTSKNLPQVHHDRTVVLSRLQLLFYRVLVYTHQFISWLVFILQKGFEPFSKESTLALMAVERHRSPLTNALFSLGSEVSARPCPQLWACAQNTQLALMVLAGGGVERFLWRELKLVMCEEVSWTRALYSLRHTLWPGGVFVKSNKKKLSEAELEQLKRKAADAFKKFLPSMFTCCVFTDIFLSPPT